MKRRIVKKALSGLLALTMAAGLMLTGCGSSGQETASASAETGAADTETAAEAKPAAEEAAVEEDVMGGDPVELRLIMYGDMTTRREEFFKNEFHDRVLEELNLDVSIEMMPWGSNETTIPTMLASGEDFAVYCILSTCDWANKGYLAEIPMESIEKYMPEYLDMRGANDFSCVKYDGKIYTIPFGEKAMSGNMQGYEIRNDILNEVGYDAAEIDTYEELTAAYDAVKAAYPNLRISTSGPEMIAAGVIGENEYYTYLGDVNQYAVINELEEGDQVYSFFETEYFKKLCGLAAEWLEKGYTSEDFLTNPTQPLADWNAGQCLQVYGTPGGLVDTALAAVAPEADLQLVSVGDVPRVKTINYDWGIAISASGQDKVDAWLRLFNWMYASQENYDFCVYGIEGTDYEKDENGNITKLVTDSFFDEWFMACSKFKHYDPSIPEEKIEQYEHLDDDALISKSMGFVFDSSNVSAEVAALSAAYTEYMDPIFMGFKDYDEYFDEALQKMKDAGLDKYVAEVQTQFSEFYAENQQ